MVVVSPVEKGIGIQVRKKLGKPLEYGERIYGDYEYGDYTDKYGIYQVRTRTGHQVVVQEKFYAPANPQTEAQQANRQKMTNGVAAWQALTPEQKEVYNKRAKYKHFSGYNLFLREYLLSN